MMATRLPTPQTTSDDRIYGIDLDGVRVRYRLQWRPRASGWYMALYAADGVTLVSDWMRLRPSGLCTQDRTAPGHPPGAFVVAGSSPGTSRDDLWRDMQIVYVPDAELS